MRRQFAVTRVKGTAGQASSGTHGELKHPHLATASSEQPSPLPKGEGENQTPSALRRFSSSVEQSRATLYPLSGTMCSWTESRMSATWGKKASSISSAGVIQFLAPTITGGASSSSNANWVILAANVCRALPRSQALRFLIETFGFPVTYAREVIAAVFGDDEVEAEARAVTIERMR